MHDQAREQVQRVQRKIKCRALQSIVGKIAQAIPRIIGKVYNQQFIKFKNKEAISMAERPDPEKAFELMVRLLEEQFDVEIKYELGRKGEDEKTA